MIYFSLIFDLRDVWVGVFVDTKRKRIYVLPIPCMGIVIGW